MTTIINIETNKYQLSDLLALVRGGNEVIVQEADKPTVKLSLAESSQPRKPKPLVLGLLAGKGTVPDDFNDELPMEFWLGEDA
jgi:antitoxin (DNA-binding transcriptional repressor) of toxin-antitoxin stability system